MHTVLQDFLAFAVLVCVTRTKSRAAVFNHNGDCMFEDYSVICGNTLPQELPENFTKVTVKDYLQENISNDTFKHSSWELVDYLDITANNNIDFQLHDFNFFALKNLKTLGIHSSRLTLSDSEYIFNGLMELKVLNLSSCYSLLVKQLFVNLETQNSLEALLIDKVSKFYAGKVVVDNVFLETISKLKIKKLSLSGCNIVTKGPLYISNLSFSLNIVDFSKVTLEDKFDRSDRKQIVTVFSKLKIFNISEISYIFVPFSYWFLFQGRRIAHCGEQFSDDYSYLFYKVERLEMNSVLPAIVKIKNTYMDTSGCNFNLKTLHLRTNNINYFNATIKAPKKHHFYEIDLSQNDLQYLSPSVFMSFKSMQRILLAHNKLYLMTSFQEFKYLFSTFKNLRYLDLSHNQFSWLPKTLFAANLELATLDLSNNHLTSISFEVQQLTKLGFLNMEYNRVHFVDGTDLRNLMLLMQKLPVPANISFLHNPIVCTCESVTFITWFSSYVKTTKMQRYECSLEGRSVPLGKGAVDEAKFLCIRSNIIIALVSTSTASVFFISLVAASVLYRKRQLRKERNMANFVHSFKNGLLKQKFLCFFSYSDDDEENDIGNIYDRLSETLKENTGMEQDVVSIGERHVKLGVPIVDEILRLVSESCVVVSIVSNNFCKSNWCQMELREAYELNKPIILILKEEIDINNMSPLLFKIFRQNTRVKLVTNEDGQQEIVPGYGQLSSSILRLAAMQNDINNV